MGRLIEFLPVVNAELCLLWTLTLLHFLWQGCAVYIAVMLGHRLLQRRTARSRYLIDLTGLLTLPACVVVTAMVLAPENGPSGELIELSVFSSADPGQGAVAGLDTAVDVLPVGANVTLSAEKTRAADVGISTTSGAPSWTAVVSAAAPFVAAGWLAGVLIFLSRLMFAIRSSHRLRRASQVITDPHLLVLIRQASERMKLRCVPVVAYCERVVVPVVSGVVRPVVLLPAGLATGLNSDQLIAVISHELSHIRRLDLLVNMLQRLVESTLFFHPAVWLISRRMSDTRESCCDEMVVDAGCEPMLYAGALLRMAELCRSPATVPSTTVAALGQGRSQLERRVMQLMDGRHPDRLQMTRAGFVTALSLMMLLAFVPGVVQNWAYANVASASSAVTDDDALGAEQERQRLKAPVEHGAGDDSEALPAEFDFCFVDAGTGRDIDGNHFTFHTIFREPTQNDRPGRVVDNVIWGSRATNRISLVVSERVLEHADHRNLTVEWAVSHPEYQAARGEFVLGTWLDSPLGGVRESLRTIRLQPNREVVLSRLLQPVNFLARSEALSVVLDRLQQEFGVPVTIHHDELSENDGDMRTAVTVVGRETPLRDVLERAMDAARVSYEMTSAGIRIPARPTGLSVDYSIGGAEQTGKLYLQHLGGDSEVGGMIERFTRWTPLANGTTARLEDLRPGAYEIARVRSVVAVGADGAASMRLGVYLDRQQCQIEAGEFRSIDLTRPAGRPVVGRVTGPVDQNYYRPIYFVCSTNTPMIDPTGSLDVTLYDANNTDEDGLFRTESLLPGEYLVIAQAWEREPQVAPGLNRNMAADFVGQTSIFIPETGELPLCDIVMVARDEIP